jgi:hypothetical protein
MLARSILLRYRSSMDAEQFRAALDRHDLTYGDLARLAGRPQRNVRKWGSGQLPVPLTVVLAFRLMDDTGLMPEDAVELAETVMDARKLTADQIAALDLPSLRRDGSE